MPTFIGFNTQGQNKKFTLTDFELIKRDLANAFGIQQGELPGRPAYGSNIWAYLFENQTVVNEQLILQEIQRVASFDPRIQITDATLYPQENGIRIEVQLRVVNSTTAERLALFFDAETRRALLV